MADLPTATLRRYRCVTKGVGLDAWAEMVEDPNGAYVLHSDLTPHSADAATVTDDMVEAGARRMAQLVRAGIIEKPPLTEWEPWAGSVRAVLEAALARSPSSTVARVDLCQRLAEELRLLLNGPDEHGIGDTHPLVVEARSLAPSSIAATGETPRTDAEARTGRLWHDGWYGGPGTYVPAEFARQLERELSLQSATREFEEKPIGWLVFNYSGTGKEQVTNHHFVLGNLTDATFMDEGDEAWPLYRRSDSRITDREKS